MHILGTKTFHQGSAVGSEPGTGVREPCRDFKGAMYPAQGRPQLPQVSHVMMKDASLQPQSTKQKSSWCVSLHIFVISQRSPEEVWIPQVHGNPQCAGRSREAWRDGDSGSVGAFPASPRRRSCSRAWTRPGLAEVREPATAHGRGSSRLVRRDRVTQSRRGSHLAPRRTYIKLWQIPALTSTATRSSGGARYILTS